MDVFLETYKKPPGEIVMDLDPTDTPLHGEQEGRFFHGYYNQYCCRPLYIFCGEHLLCARLRPSNIDASAGSVQEIERIVQQIRRRWRPLEAAITSCAPSLLSGLFGSRFHKNCFL